MRPVVRARRGRLGAVLVGQVVALQIAAAAVLVGMGFGLIGLAVGAVVALLVLVATFTPVGGRWLFETVVLRWRLATRRRRRSRPNIADHRLRALTELAPALVVRDVADRMQRVGIASDADGWFAAVAVVNTGGLNGLGAGMLPIAELTAVLSEGGLRGARLQVVTHAVPAPTTSLPAGCPAFVSYQDLPGAAAVAAQRHTWVAVRLPAPAAADAAASRGGGPNGVGKALAAIVGRVAKVLASAGIEYRILDTVGLTEALARCTGLDAAPTTQDARIDEGWDRLLADGVAYASLAVTRWPEQRPGVPGLLSVLARVPAAMTTLSVSLDDSDDGTVSLRTLLRVAALPAALPAAVAAAKSAGRAGRLPAPAAARATSGRHVRGRTNRGWSAMTGPHGGADQGAVGPPPVPPIPAGPGRPVGPYRPTGSSGVGGPYEPVGSAGPQSGTSSPLGPTGSAPGSPPWPSTAPPGHPSRWGAPPPSAAAGPPPVPSGASGPASGPPPLPPAGPHSGQPAGPASGPQSGRPPVPPQVRHVLVP